MFAQKTFGKMFSAEGKFAGQSVEHVAAALRGGKLNPAEIPVSGRTIILNTRSAQALESAGIPRSAWCGIDKTGDLFFERLLDGQLSRNLGGAFTTVRPSGGK